MLRKPYVPTENYLTFAYRTFAMVITFALVLGVVIQPTAAQNADQKHATAAVAIPTEATVESLFTDFLHYARMGRFTAANAYAEALLKHPDLDPLKLLLLSSKDKKSLNTLLIIIKNSTIGNSAARVLKLIGEGEKLKRQDTDRILYNINLLGGNPQQEFFARQHLTESGEYAIPHMVQTLLDPSKSELWPRVVAALPQIGKDAVNPLVIALNVNNDDVRQNLILALGEIGYTQATPYLQKLIANPGLTEETKKSARKAISRIEQISARHMEAPTDELFYSLGVAYYNEHHDVRADPRLDNANVWYWDESLPGLSRTVVPTKIFGPVMAMRCSEEAIMTQNDHQGSIALWLASNIRRESRLGFDVESGDPSETREADPTRPDAFPRALHFSQAAGPRYAHLILERAVQDKDSATALGAIRALRLTAGESSLTGTEDYKQPLVLALHFPDLAVRIRAALALGVALPKSQFVDSQYVIPVLAKTLTMTGREQLLVVDPDKNNLNRIMDELRSGDRDVIGETSFYQAMKRARKEFQSLSGLFISTDVTNPGLTVTLWDVRGEFTIAKTPVVILTKPKQEVLAREIAEADAYVETVASLADATELEDAFERVRIRTGQTRLDSDQMLAMALEATETLRIIAVDGRTIYDVRQAEPALIASLSSPEEQLQTLAASVLALLPTPTAQRAIAHVAMDDSNTDSLRIAAFGSLAESAKIHGQLLEADQVTDLVRITSEEHDLVMRTAASKALGAINLASSQASEIIRSYHGG